MADASRPGTTEPPVSESTAPRVEGERDIALSVNDLEKHFGGIAAIDGASFFVERGTFTGLIGPNGAGKTTTFNCITGVFRPEAGQVVFQGEDVTGLRPHEMANRGLVRTFQIARELREMTVLENLMLAPRNQVGELLTYAVVPSLRRQVVAQEEELREAVWDTIEFFEIGHLADEYAGNLSGGQRKLLELARALMVEPNMLLLDEPFAGVNPTLQAKLLDRIHRLKDEGMTFLLVEHDMDVVMEHCEHIVVMHQGKVLAEGPAEAVKGDERVIDAYLGEDV